jgi:hypothetical protein
MLGEGVVQASFRRPFRDKNNIVRVVVAFGASPTVTRVKL